MATRAQRAWARYEEAAQEARRADERAHKAWQRAHEEGTVEAVEEAYRLQEEANEAMGKAIHAQHHASEMTEDKTTQATETTTTTSNEQEEQEMEERRQEVAQAVATAIATTTQTRMQMNIQFFAQVGKRANRVVVRTEADGFVAEFFKTHKSVAVVASEDTEWKRNKDHNPTQAREDFRTWVQAHAIEFGVDWSPEYQQQAWNRKYWKYETDQQVEEDAIELMGWTIKTTCEKVGLNVEIGQISLDSIVPMESNLGYVHNGKYDKNGNWAVAQVNLEVRATIEDTEIDIIYPIEMRSGQLTKIKLTKDELQEMVNDSKIA